MGPEGMIPLFAVAVVFSVPVIALLTKHQQKMAIILRQGNQLPNGMPVQTDPRILAELDALRQLVTEQTIMIDDLSKSQRELAQRLSTDEVRERLNRS